MKIEEFAAQRTQTQREVEKSLRGSVKAALRKHPRKGWQDPLVARAQRALRAAYHDDTGRWTSPALRTAQRSFARHARSMLRQTPRMAKDEIDVTAERITRSLATTILSLSTEVAASDSGDTGLYKVWVSMDDERVRPSHAAADGQRARLNRSFTVGGFHMMRPGDLRAPIHEWINCRCVLAIVAEEDEIAAASQLVNDDGAPLVAALPAGVDMYEDEFPPLDEADRLDYVDEAIPFWGVMAPEGVESGDARRFSAGSLRSRPYPLPLAYQRTNEGAHGGSFKVGNIEAAWRKGDLIYYSGHFLTTVPEVDEVIGVMAESGGRSGVSIDADDGEMELYSRTHNDTVENLMAQMEPGDEIELDMDDLVTEFTSARICGATMCTIPAFHEAFTALGEVPEEFLPEDGEELAVEARFGEAVTAACYAISEKPWDGSASRFTDEEWYRSTILHINGSSKVKSDNKLPIREPNGDLSRAGVHAAAGRISQVDAPPRCHQRRTHRAAPGVQGTGRGAAGVPDRRRVRAGYRGRAGLAHPPGGHRPAARLLDPRGWCGEDRLGHPR